MKVVFGGLLLFVVSIIWCAPLQAQDPTYIVSKDDVQFDYGTLSFFRNIHELRIVYDYSSMKVAEFQSEKEYTDFIVADAESKYPGKGER